MATKKKSKAKKFASKAAPKEDNLGFFARNRDVIPQQAPPRVQTRVKTFIVEKPIIVHDKPQHIYPTRGEDERIYDAKKSKYAKKKIPKDFEDGAAGEGEDGTGDSGELGDDFDSTGEGNLESELNEDDTLSKEEGASEGLEGEEGVEGEEGAEGEFGAEDGAEGLEEKVIKKHARSRGLFVNVWWKKAIIWAVLVWILFLALEFVMQYLKLVELDLTRQWWFLLAGFIVIAMVYFGVLESRVKF